MLYHKGLKFIRKMKMKERSTYFVLLLLFFYFISSSFVSPTSLYKCFARYNSGYFAVKFPMKYSLIERHMSTNKPPFVISIWIFWRKKFRNIFLFISLYLLLCSLSPRFVFVIRPMNLPHRSVIYSWSHRAENSFHIF